MRMCREDDGRVEDEPKDRGGVLSTRGVEALLDLGAKTVIQWINILKPYLPCSKGKAGWACAVSIYPAIPFRLR